MRIDVARLSRLCRLSPNETEAARLSSELACMAAFADRLPREEEDSVSSLCGVTREDEAGACLSTEAATSAAAEVWEGYVAVPRVLGEED